MEKRTIWVTDEIWQMWSALAKVGGVSVSQLVRDTATAEAAIRTVEAYEAERDRARRQALEDYRSI